jgi:hypothetical protein
MFNSRTQELIIKFNGVQLSEEAVARIQKGINDLLLHELAGYHTSVRDTTNSNIQSDDYCGVYIPHKWIGREVIRLDLKNIESIYRKDATLDLITPVTKFM